MNAFNAALRSELLAQIRRAEEDGQCAWSCSQAAPKAFSVGADLKEPYSPAHETVEGLSSRNTSRCWTPSRARLSPT